MQYPLIHLFNTLWKYQKETDREFFHDPFLSRTLSLSQMMLPLLGQEEL